MGKLKRWERRKMGWKWWWMEIEDEIRIGRRKAIGEGRQRSNRRRWTIRMHGSTKNSVCFDWVLLWYFLFHLTVTS